MGAVEPRLTAQHAPNRAAPECLAPSDDPTADPVFKRGGDVGRASGLLRYDSGERRTRAARNGRDEPRSHGKADSQRGSEHPTASGH